MTGGYICNGYKGGKVEEGAFESILGSSLTSIDCHDESILKSAILQELPTNRSSRSIQIVEANSSTASSQATLYPTYGVQGRASRQICTYQMSQCLGPKLQLIYFSFNAISSNCGYRACRDTTLHESIRSDSLCALQKPVFPEQKQPGHEPGSVSICHSLATYGTLDHAVVYVDWE